MIAGLIGEAHGAVARPGAARPRDGRDGAADTLAVRSHAAIGAAAGISRQGIRDTEDRALLRMHEGLVRNGAYVLAARIAGASEAQVAELERERDEALAADEAARVARLEAQREARLRDLANKAEAYREAKRLRQRAAREARRREGTARREAEERERDRAAVRRRVSRVVEKPRDGACAGDAA